MSILDTVCNQCQNEGYSIIHTIRLRIGKGSNILPDALQFSFEIAKSDTIASKAELIIDNVPLGGQCNTCDQKFEIDQYIYNCPHCNGTNLEINQGFEMEIVDMDVD